MANLAGKVVPYKGAHSQADILKFLAKNVKEVKAGWEDKVKPVLKEVKEAAAEQKRKAGACLSSCLLSPVCRSVVCGSVRMVGHMREEIVGEE